MAAKKQVQIAEPLANWSSLNAALKLVSEEDCWGLLKKEKQGQKRAQFMMRIHSRANKLRADRERRELLGGK